MRSIPHAAGCVDRLRFASADGPPFGTKLPIKNAALRLLLEEDLTSASIAEQSRFGRRRHKFGSPQCTRGDLL
jgi:hypothetical protein